MRDPRYIARVLAHAFLSGSRPPDSIVKEALSYPDHISAYSNPFKEGELFGLRKAIELVQECFLDSTGERRVVAMLENRIDDLKDDGWG